MEARPCRRLAPAPERLGESIPEGHDGWVLLDEIHRAPEFLDEVHRLIEERALRFALTGSCARKLRRSGANVLAGRTRTLTMHRVTPLELREDFDLARALRFGLLPFACKTSELEL